MRSNEGFHVRGIGGFPKRSWKDHRYPQRKCNFKSLRISFYSDGLTTYRYICRMPMQPYTTWGRFPTSTDIHTEPNKRQERANINICISVFAVMRYTWLLLCRKQVRNRNPKPSFWPAAHRTSFWLEKVRYIWSYLLCLAFNWYCRILSQSEAMH